MLDVLMLIGLWIFFMVLYQLMKWEIKRDILRKLTDTPKEDT